MLRCKDVHHLVSSGAVDQAGLMKRLELKFHLLMCRHCRTYVAQMAALGSGMRALVGRQQPDPAALARMERDILNECCGEQHDSPGPT
jgi:predicted anti-sigma-YlaC factor YlaD